MTRITTSVPDISVVVIGRNEGERLSRCLASVRAADWGALSHELIYVDSRSSDNSCERARALGAMTLSLDEVSPCAAKARNLGWRAATARQILFLDGDTELHPQFAQRAREALQTPEVCAVWGHRRERHPEQSVYTRVLDLDWLYPTGRTLYFGGDVLIRREALEQVGGFDPTLNAGEEPELCARLRARGWQIEHIDAPMTRHDLAISSWAAYWRRAYRSGVAYAEVADRMRGLQDPLWQYEARRDYWHGLLYLSAPLILGAALLLAPSLALMLLALALLVLGRTASRSAWKAPRQAGLLWLYAVHSHLQKVPALFGQWAWRRARRQQAALGLIEYKQSATAQDFRRQAKSLLIGALQPLARLWRKAVHEGLARAWHLAALRASVAGPVCASNVLLGPVEVHGSARIRFGRGALIYPGVYLETQGEGEIVIGDGVVLSRGVHIVAHQRVELGDGVMVGEYSSLRDADHRRDAHSIRHSGHVAQAIHIEGNVWIGRGVAVLKGVRLGASAIVGANAVVTRSVPAGVIVRGVPARHGEQKE